MGVSRVRALIRAPLPQVWEFLIKPENLHVWGPATRPVTGFDRPFQAGDRVTFYRRLQALLEKPHADSILGSGQEEHTGA